MLNRAQLQPQTKKKKKKNLKSFGSSLFMFWMKSKQMTM